MENVKKAAVVGAGMIGISMCALLTGNGVETFLYTRSRQKERKEQYDQILAGLVEDGLLEEEQKEICASYLHITSSYEELEEVDIAFECVAENLETKREVFANLRTFCPGLLVAVSTSSAISSRELAVASGMEDKVLVAHPFYPPHLIPCVEVVPNAYTSAQSLEILKDFLENLNREVVVIKKDAPGFIANRLQYAMLREAIHIVEQGIAEPRDVDRMLKYSFAPRYTAIGIFEHFDNCGLDLARDISDYLYPDLCSTGEAQSYVREKCDNGHYGVKSGQGTYFWNDRDVEDLKERVKAPYLKCFSWNIPEKFCEMQEDRN